MRRSQSAFAGYGLGEPLSFFSSSPALNVAIRFRWIWVGRATNNLLAKGLLKSRNPLSLDMGWESGPDATEEMKTAGRNPLSLDMGWESVMAFLFAPACTVAIRFRWIWVGRGFVGCCHHYQRLVAIRFRWIWVGREIHYKIPGYRPGVAIRFRWIWVGRDFKRKSISQSAKSRNPLSLDMGWKSGQC